MGGHSLHTHFAPMVDTASHAAEHVPLSCPSVPALLCTLASIGYASFDLKSNTNETHDTHRQQR